MQSIRSSLEKLSHFSFDILVYYFSFFLLLASSVPVSRCGSSNIVLMAARYKLSSGNRIHQRPVFYFAKCGFNFSKSNFKLIEIIGVAQLRFFFSLSKSHPKIPSI